MKYKFEGSLQELQVWGVPARTTSLRGPYVKYKFEGSLCEVQVWSFIL